MEDWLKLKEDQYEDDGDSILAMKEINQRRKELKMMEDEWFAIWMLGNVRKRKIIDKIEYQSLWQIVKEGSTDVLEKFEKKLKTIRVEGHRKSVSTVRYKEDIYDDLPKSYYTTSELEEIETMYMGTESEAKKRFQRKNSFNQRRQSFDGRQRSLSRGSQSGRYALRSRYNGYKSGEQGDSSQFD